MGGECAFFWGLGCATGSMPEYTSTAKRRIGRLRNAAPLSISDNAPMGDVMVDVRIFDARIPFLGIFRVGPSRVATESVRAKSKRAR